MSEIKCPECKKTFKINETSYAKIRQQVRDEEFKASVAEQVKQLNEKNLLEFNREKNDLEKTMTMNYQY